MDSRRSDTVVTSPELTKPISWDNLCSDVRQFSRVPGVGAVDGFAELFRRMTRNPYFTAEIAEFEIKYHKPLLEWFAMCDGTRYPGAGVLSLGDLNACALSLFLAFSLAQPNPLGMLILDDPVQNMDDLHIEEFADILRAIRDDANAQILLGVHDEAVFEYLKRQLHPSRPGQKLLAYTLERAGDATIIKPVSVIEYSPTDFLVVGSAAA